MKIATALERARALIERQENWGKDYFAKDAHGRIVGVTTPEAVRFCARGAIMRVAKGKYESAAENFMQTVGGMHIGEFNNYSSHDEVLMAFDFAILAAKDEGK